jgi:hypothetical protein
MSAVVRATLVTGASAAQREQAIAARLEPHCQTAVILEGFPDGTSPLQNLEHSSHVKIFRIAAGCLCCTGNLVMRVTLNRILRDPPQRFFLSIADASHIEALRNFLTAAPYDELLVLTEDCPA